MKIHPRSLFLACLAALSAAAFVPDAGAQTLLVDQADNNSPYPVITSQTYTTVHVGDQGTGEIDQSAYTFTVNGSGSGQGLYIGYNTAANGTYNLSGTGSLISNYSADVGTFGTALFSQSGGSAAFNGYGLLVGYYNGSNGTYNQTGGSVTATGLNLGYFGGSTGAYTLSGGTLSTGLNYLGLNGTGTFTQNGGTWTTNGSAIQVGLNGGSAGTLNLNGGTVTAGSVLGSQGGGGNSTLNLNGGTLQAAASTTGFINGLNTANVRAGGAIIDSNGFNVTVPQALVHSTIAGDSATDGGLSKVGLGTLTLTAANTYTGQTSVTAGTLALPSGGSIGVSGGQANLSVAGTAANAPTLVVSGGSVTAGTVYLGYNPGEVGTITQSAGTVTINGSNNTAQGLFVGYNVNDTGLYTLTGGNLVLNHPSSVGTFGNGTVNQSGGSVTVGGYGLTLGLYNGGSGTYNLSGTGSLSGGGVTVGGYSGSGTGLLHQIGGTLNLTQLQIGRNDQGSGAMGTYTLDAGSATAGGVIVGDGTGSTGSVNLNGGTLTTYGVLGEGGTSTFRFNGGTLQASGSSTTFVSGLTNAYVGTGGAVINTNGFNVTLASALAADPANGNATDGGLTKNGAGTLTLTANSTYTGTTVVGNGALMVNNTPAKAGDSGTGRGAVFVEEGTWLGGTGTVGGNVTVGANPPSAMGQAIGVRPLTSASAGTLTPGVATGGVSTPGRLTINGSLTFTTGTSMLEADIAGAAAGTGYDQVVVVGKLTLAGALTLTTGAGFTPTPGEKFYLFEDTGSAAVSGTFDNLPQGSRVMDSAGNQYVISYTDSAGDGTAGNDVSLVAVPEPSEWIMGGLLVAVLGLTLRRRRRV